MEVLISASLESNFTGSYKKESVIKKWPDANSR